MGRLGDGQGAGEHQHAGLADLVGGEGRHGPQGIGVHIDQAHDPPEALTAHDRQHRLAGVVGDVEGLLHGGVPFGSAGVFQALPDDAAGVVHQDVEPAQLLGRGAEGGGCGLGIGQVGCHRQSPAAHRLHFGHHGLGFGGARVVVNHQVGAGAGQGQGDAAARAAGAAGDQGDPAMEGKGAHQSSTVSALSRASIMSGWWVRMMSAPAKSTLEANRMRASRSGLRAA